MADEIKTRLNLLFAGRGHHSGIIRSFSLPLVATGYLKGTASVSTTIENFTLPVRNGGWVWIRNLDPTNFITVHPTSTATSVAQVGPGEFFLARTSRSVFPLWLKADTAAVTIEYLFKAGVTPNFLETEDSTLDDPVYLLQEEDGLTPIELE